MTTAPVSEQLAKAARRLSRAVDKLSFGPPVTHVYNPLKYAWKSHQAYLNLANDCGVKVVMLGMNPGPWGMAQTGVPFGEVAAVRDWIGINEKIRKPKHEHPKRIIDGFACSRSEVSGRRLWGLFQDTFDSSTDFFEEHFILNYCPLVFMEESARNRTPDKLAASEREALGKACDKHLISVLDILDPEIVVGVGAYAEKCATRVIDQSKCGARVTRILHPSPASPAANKNWSTKAAKQLRDAGVW